MKATWDDDNPNMMGKIRNVPNHQPDNISCPAGPEGHSNQLGIGNRVVVALHRFFQSLMTPFVE